jgi:outer membrane protein TolC
MRWHGHTGMPARYASGYSPYLEQLDAQRGLLAAELAPIQSQSDALTARVALFQALGGGWLPERTTTDPQNRK